MKFSRLSTLLQLIHFSQTLRAGRDDITKLRKLSRHAPAEIDSTPTATNDDSTLSKRQSLMKGIQVVLHFDCPFTGKSHEIFEWSVVYDSPKHEIHYFRHTNIDGFQEETKTWDVYDFPAAFVGSWYYNDWDEIEYDEYFCRLSYVGHFEGLVEWSDVLVVFIDADETGRQMPLITEHCRGHTSRTGGVPCAPYHCGKKCKFERAEVSWPTFV